MGFLSSESILVLGVLFPVISLLTIIASLRYSTPEHYVSPVLIPFFGPLLLSGWVIMGNHPIWLIPVFCLCDLGTLLYLAAGPSLIREWWATSKYTLVLKLHGSSGVESVVLSLHQSGRYSMTKTWQRIRGQLGPMSIGEPGTYRRVAGTITLLSHLGTKRTLTSQDESTYIVQEESPLKPDQATLSLSGWLLEDAGAQKQSVD